MKRGGGAGVPFGRDRAMLLLRTLEGGKVPAEDVSLRGRKDRKALVIEWSERRWSGCRGGCGGTGG